METEAQGAAGPTARYGEDFAAWTKHQVQILRSGNLSELDIENLIEEIEALGRAEQRLFRLAVKQVLASLAKLAYSHAKQLRAQWQAELIRHRDELDDALGPSPCLEEQLARTLAHAWPGARLIALAELAALGDAPSMPFESPFAVSDLR